MKKKRRKPLKKIAWLLVIMAAAGIVFVTGINSYMKATVKDGILSAEEAAKLQDVDCILILGCGVWEGGVPTPMLSDRLERGIELYESGVSGKLLMSGDHGRKEYDEVNVMKRFAVEAGVPSEDVFMDHAGFSTYESLYRARDIFEAGKMVIVTQGYHMYRALYVAEKLGLEAYGICSDQQLYAGQEYREAREVLARAKDFLTVIYKPEPTFLGEIIPVSGDGNLTND